MHPLVLKLTAHHLTHVIHDSILELGHFHWLCISLLLDYRVVESFYLIFDATSVENFTFYVEKLLGILVANMLWICNFHAFNAM